MKHLALSFALLLSCMLPLTAQDAFTVLRPPNPPERQITPYLRWQTEQGWRQDAVRAARFAMVRDRSGMLELQRELRASLLANLGGLPAEKSPLEARVTGTIERPGYRIEKVVFESLPGFHVTANLYIPEGAGPFPAVLVALGHSAIGKAYPVYQKICGRLARRGYVALTWDPVGQAERSQFWDSATNDSRYNRVCGEHAVIGNLAYLAGTSLARWEVWDGIRAHDYLLTRPEVDPARIAVTGNSGGGFQSAFLGALDPRNRVVIPSCYLSSLPMRMANRIFADPDSDPEQDLYRMVSSGVDHAGLIALVWPRPIMMSVAVEDFFPIEGGRKAFREVSDLYRVLGAPERIGMVEGYHGHGFSEHNQEQAFAFLDRFMGCPERWNLDSIPVLEEQELRCTASGQVRLEYPDDRGILELIRDYARERRAAGGPLSLAELYRGENYPGIEHWEVVAHDPAGSYPEGHLAWEAAGGEDYRGTRVDRYVLHHDGILAMPLVHVYRPGQRTGKAALVFTREGKLSAASWAEAERLLDQGWEVLSPDFRAQGENMLQFTVVSVDDPRLAAFSPQQQYRSPLSGTLANHVYNSLLTGRPYFLQLIEDLEIAGKFARERLGAKALAVTAPGEAATVAAAAAEVLPGMQLLPHPQGQPVNWQALVEQMREDWPVEYLLPGGAYVR